MSRPSPSTLAACAWVAGGLLATAVLQAATGGEHSVSAGIRRHPLAFALLNFAFGVHLFLPQCVRPVDPFRLLAAGSKLARS